MRGPGAKPPVNSSLAAAAAAAASVAAAAAAVLPQVFRVLVILQLSGMESQNARPAYFDSSGSSFKASTNVSGGQAVAKLAKGPAQLQSAFAVVLPGAGAVLGMSSGRLQPFVETAAIADAHVITAATIREGERERERGRKNT